MGSLLKWYTKKLGFFKKKKGKNRTKFWKFVYQCFIFKLDVLFDKMKIL